MGKKGEAQRQRVIESASYCLSQFGERGATFQAISNHCKLSQASIVKYLKSRDNVFPTVLEYWIERARKITQESLLEVGTPEEKLREYIRVSIRLFFEENHFNKIYLMLHYFAGFDERQRVVNSQIKTIARERIAVILRAGIDDGSFRPLDVETYAKTIHNALVGYLIGSVTELSKPSDLQLPQALEDACLDLVRAPSS